MNLRKVQAVARKEFYHLIRDFRSLYLAFALPLLLILLFGYALSLDVDHVKTVVVDFDRTDLSRDFLSRFESSPYFDVIAHVKNIEAVTRYLDHGWTTMAVLIPPDFTENISRTGTPPSRFSSTEATPTWRASHRDTRQNSFPITITIS